MDVSQAYVDGIRVLPRSTCPLLWGVAMSDQTSIEAPLPWRAIKEPEWRAVLASNAAMARTDTEEGLISEICASAVVAGGYMLAWYGRGDCPRFG